MVPIFEKLVLPLEHFLFFFIGNSYIHTLHVLFFFFALVFALVRA